MGCEEILSVAAARIDVTHHHEEAGMLQVEVGVDVDERIVARLHTVVACLHGILSERRTVVGGIILCEVASVGTKVAFQHLCNLEAQVEVGVDVEVWHGQHIVVCRLLICYDIFPVERSQLKVLCQRQREQRYCSAFLSHLHGVALA